MIRRGNSQRLIPIRNQQWSVTALIDADTGGALERYAYDVFGERIILAPDATSIRQKSWYENQYGYTSRRHDAESGSMYFRTRYFEPTTGEFTSQYPLEYVDGMSLYRAYFVPGGLDPTGKSCSVTPCKKRCDLKGGLLGQLCKLKCQRVANKFLKWFDKQLHDGKPDYGSLPSCPCSITCAKECRYFINGKVTKKKICAPEGWKLSSPTLYPFYLPRYHPDASWDMRSNGDQPRTQCTYDAAGDLITHGPGIGTVDEQTISVHIWKDVRPVDLIIFLEGGKLTGGCWFNLYKKVRPMINRNKCPRNYSQ